MNNRQYSYNLGSLAIALLITEGILCGLAALFYFVIQKQISGLRLENEWLLLGLLAGPLFSFFFFLVIRWKNRALQRFGDTNLLPYFAQPISTAKTVFRFLLYRTALTAVVIAAVNPKMGSRVSEGKSKGIDIMFCVDVSNSMLAEDIKPNRLTRAKRAIEQVIDRLHGDRIGLVVFAGEAYNQLPLTSDYGAAKLFLSTVGPDLVPVQGTSLSAAIDLAVDGFDFEKKKSGKAIVIITDGESHEGDALVSAEHAADNKIPVYCIGMGTAAGGPIPSAQNGKSGDFKRDENGQIVVSKLNEQALAEVANAGKGVFIRATNEDAGVDLVVKEINKQTKTELDSVIYADYEDRFQLFAGIALVLLLIETVLTDKKSKWVEKINWFNAEV
ncbi:MAG: VWA domain-containing protein [Bacteroidota bacterium]